MPNKCRISLIVLASLLSLSTSSALADEAAEGSIKVTVTGLSNDQGVVRVSLFASPETYNNDHNVGMGAFRQITVPVVAKSAQAVFTEMPYGIFAVKVFHDADNSGRFVTSALGKPRVDYGCSNNARAFWRFPSFKRAKFDLHSDLIAIEINTDKNAKQKK